MVVRLMYMMFSLLLFSFIFNHTQSFALSCEEPPQPDIAFDNYEGVIIGKVQNVKESNRRKILTIEVEKSYKGVDESVITVYEDVDWGVSKLNLTYVYFLNKRGDKWVNQDCSSTTGRLSIADEYFSDKEEIPLKIVTIEEINSKQQWSIPIIIVILLGVIIIVVARKRK